jgi:hypothetical protein
MSESTKHPDFTKSLGEAQPIAFLFAASLILANFLDNDPAGQQWALIAALAFFFAYIGLHLGKATGNDAYLYLTGCLMLLGFALLLYSFSNVILEIVIGPVSSMKVFAWGIILSVFYVSIYVAINDCEKMNGKRYQFTRIFAFISLLAFVSAVIHINMRHDIAFLLPLAVSLLFLGISFAFVFLGSNQKRIVNKEKTK